ncbi:MAG TPA: alginate lyase family protein [Planctomycetota bacterium]|nr:alginate lyase family protein [Planctomycetota bacterium]
MSFEKVPLRFRVGSFVKKGPRYAAAYGAWRARRMLSASFGGRPAWPSAPELERTAAPPLCDWARRESIVEAVPEASRARTIALADGVVERRFRYRGREEAFPGPVDWSLRPGGNLDWTWDLNRHYFFVVLGRAYWYTRDERYARAFSELLQDWMRANPPSVEAPAWRVFEVATRAANWCWGHALLDPSPSLDASARVEIARGLLAMGRFIHSHIERHAWNNHLFLEAKALAMLGLLYPELPGASAWRKDGLAFLEKELSRQVLEDGVHSERAALYHVILSSELLEHMVVLKLCGQGERDPHYCKALVKLVSMAIFLGSITRPDGTFPLLGDSSLHDEHIRFEPLAGAKVLLDAPGIPTAEGDDEGLAWLLGAIGAEGRVCPSMRSGSRARQSRAFPVGGYCVLESERGALSRGAPLHLIFDCGPFGDPVVPGHGHADALSIDLAVGRSHLIVDPGMYSAHLGERWRNFFRGTSAHNTVVVDGRDQSILSGLRRVYRPARTRLLAWASCPVFDIAAGEHMGYRRLSRGVTHRREIFFPKRGSILLVDRIDGRGKHRVEQLFHLHPRARPQVDPDLLAAVAFLDGGPGVAIVPLRLDGLEAAVLEGHGEGDGGAPQGWVSFTSGLKEPAPVLSYRREGLVPLRFAVLLVPLGPGGAAPRVEELEVFADQGEGAPQDFDAALVRHAGGRVENFIAARVGPGGPPPAPGSRRAGSLETDAVLAWITAGQDDTIESGVIFRGLEASWKRELVVRLETPLPPGQVGFWLEDGRLEIHTAVPVPWGTVFRFGRFARDVREVFVNGLDRAFERGGSGIAVAGSQDG